MKNRQKQELKPALFKAFDTVVETLSEIAALMAGHSPLRLDSQKMTLVDYWICACQIVEASQDKGAIKNFRKAITGEPIGEGSRNILVAKFGRQFIQAGLYPRQRFFVEAVAWRDSRRRQTVKLPGRKLESVGLAGDVRRYGPEGPRFQTEELEASVGDDLNLDAFVRQEISVSESESVTKSDLVA